MKKSKILITIQALLTIIFLIALILFILKTDFKTIFSLFSKINLNFIVLAVFFILSSLILKTVRLRFILNKKIPISRLFGIQVIGISFASLTPFRIGEFSKVYLLVKKGLPLKVTFIKVLFERILDLLLIGIVSLVFFLFVFKKFNIPLIFLFLVILIAIFVFIYKKFKIVSSIKKVLKLKYLCLLIIFTVVIWILETLFYQMSVLSLGKNINFFVLFGVVCIGTIMSILSILPSGLGTADFSILSLFLLFGLTNEISLSALLIIRILSIFIPLILAFAIIPFYNLSIKKIIANSKNLSNKLRKQQPLNTNK